ncbi:MAG: hypothetical protein CL785_01595 [Chloroflexi bacterium]|nr:hypothetical protein [Chloroflexota bacterium]
MNGAEFVQSAFRELRRAYETDMEGLTKEQLAWNPSEEANAIGAIYWHCMRVIDGQIHRMTGTQNIFERDNWKERVNLDNAAAGALLSDDTKNVTKHLSSEDTYEYGKQVWDELTEYVSGLTDDELDRPVDPDNPRRTVGASLRSFSLGHGWWHLGEIKYIKGLQGIGTY